MIVVLKVASWIFFFFYGICLTLKEFSLSFKLSGTVKCKPSNIRLLSEGDRYVEL